MAMINSFVALDVETTGLNPAEDKIIEIGMAKVIDGELVERYTALLNPKRDIGARIAALTGITQEMLADKPVIADLMEQILSFIGDYPILGHNVSFDYSFLKKAAVNSGFSFEKQGVDTLKLARRLLPQAEHKNLEFLCRYFGIDAGNSHRAYDDAVSAWKLYQCLCRIRPQEDESDDLITLNYQVKKDVPITPAQKRYLIGLVNLHGVYLGEEIDDLTKSRASKLIDTILSTYGR